MDDLFHGLALLAGFHSYTYARWLKQRNNRLGWLGVMLLTAAGLGATFYHMYASH